MTLRLALDIGTIREHEFDRTTVSVGRGPLNDLVLNVDGLPKTLGTFHRQDAHFEWVCEPTPLIVELHRDGKIAYRSQNASTKWTLEQGDLIRIPGIDASIEIISCDPAASQPIIHEVELSTNLTSCLQPAHALAIAKYPYPSTLLRVMAGHILAQGASPTRAFITTVDGGEIPHRHTWAMLPTVVEDAMAVGVVDRAVDPLTRLDSETLPSLDKLKSGRALIVGHSGIRSIFVPLGTPLRAYATFDFGPDALNPKSFSNTARAAHELQPLALLCFGLTDAQKQLADTLEETRYYRERERRHYLLKEFIVESPTMRALFESLNALVDSPTPVLLVGEIGTGKELLARALHHFCAARDGMLFSLNCARTADIDIDVELFGCVASELQGSVAPRKGIFELASDGTVFLEEIDRLSPLIQGKLVRMLKEGEVRRVGDSSGRPVRARLIASTHRPIEEIVESNALRRDLYLLLKDSVLRVPPLREREADILPLARTFLKTQAQKYGRAGLRLDDAVQARLTKHNWPGNVRELQILIEAAMLKADHEVITLEHLAP